MVLQQAQMVQNQLRAYALELQNTQVLSGLDWQNATVSLNGLAINFQQGRVWHTRRRSKTRHLRNSIKPSPSMRRRRRDADAGDLSAMDPYNTDAANRAANAAGLTIAQASSEQARIAALKAAGQTPQGQVQAVMAGNALAAEELDQLRASTG